MGQEDAMVAQAFDAVTHPASLTDQVLQARFDDARQVYVLGRFNNWSTTATPMTPVGRDLWVARVPGDTSPDELSFFVWSFSEPFGHIRAPKAMA
jgi:hypothetical protein